MLLLLRSHISHPSGLPAVLPFFTGEQSKELNMWYGNTKNMLRSALRQLEGAEAQGNEDWQAQTEIVETCLAEMAGMSEPTINSAKSGESRYVHRPAADKLNRAMPHVIPLLAAMRVHNRPEALKHGA